MNKKEKELIDYEHNLKIIELDKEFDQRMETLRFVRDTEKCKHEWDKERMRIKSAEIRKAMEMRRLRE